MNDLHQLKTGTNWKTFTFVIVTALVCLFATDLSVRAQEKTDYKLGDRVECDPSWGKYYKGTVVKVARENWMYRIKFDYDGTVATLNQELPCLVNQMRPLQGGGGADKPVEANKNVNKPKTNSPKDFTTLADREPIDCPIEQQQVRPNARPDTELLKKVIRCLYERRAPAGMDGAKTVDITAFQIGTARKWRPLDDIGSGNLNTMVHPIKVTWIEKTFYQSYTQQIDSISMFNCYVNAVGEWECGLAQRIKQGETKRTPRE